MGRLKSNVFPVILLCLSSALSLRCDSSDTPKKPPNVSSAVTTIKPFIVRTFSHDTSAFTQGLIYYKGKIYESTGLVNKSSLRVIQTDNGVVEKHIPVSDVFAEGIAIKDNMLVQLTWRSRRAIIYSLPDLHVIDTRTYAGEGWGITTDGLYYIMSNGSDTLYRRNDAFTITKKVAVTLRGKPLSRLNELEYARNRIYANLWYSDYIFEIDPTSGKVLRMIDCSELLDYIGALKRDDVLNGIAYNNETGSFYLTGKNWPLMFEVKIAE